METVLAALRDLGLAALPVMFAWIGAHIRNQTLREAADQAIQRAGGIAYHYLATRAAGTSAVAARDQAVREGINYLSTTIPDILAKLGVISDAAKADRVKAELGKLLATDPSTAVQVAPTPMPAAQGKPSS